MFVSFLIHLNAKIPRHYCDNYLLNLKLRLTAGWTCCISVIVVVAAVFRWRCSVLASVLRQPPDLVHVRARQHRWCRTLLISTTRSAVYDISLLHASNLYQAYKQWCGDHVTSWTQTSALDCRFMGKCWWQPVSMSEQNLKAYRTVCR